MALELVDHKALAKDKATCKDVMPHRKGQRPGSVSMQDIEFSRDGPFLQLFLWKKGQAFGPQAVEGCHCQNVSPVAPPWTKGYLTEGLG